MARIRPAWQGIVAGAAVVSVYLGVVVATTPALDPAPAISAALQLNHIVIAGMGVGVGLQVYISGRARAAGCRIGSRKTLGGNSGGAAATSFFSFFSLVPLGCCGWWLYALSLLPGVLGTGATAVLIEHSQTLAYALLAVVFGHVGVAAYRLRRERSPVPKGAAGV